ncbi:MAG: hypothetical protein AAFU61_15415, partial [Pseudomonadota bacterium]
MPRPRKQIRDAARSAIQTIDALKTVQGARSWDVTLTELPAAVVTTPEERRARLDNDGATTRSIDLRVVLMAAGADVEDVLDALADSVDAALFSDATLQALAGDEVAFEAVGESFDLGEGGDRPFGTLTLVYAAERGG